MGTGEIPLKIRCSTKMPKMTVIRKIETRKVTNRKNSENLMLRAKEKKIEKLGCQNSLKIKRLKVCESEKKQSQSVFFFQKHCAKKSQNC